MRPTARCPGAKGGTHRASTSVSTRRGFSGDARSLVGSNPVDGRIRLTVGPPRLSHTGTDHGSPLGRIAADQARLRHRRRRLLARQGAHGLQPRAACCKARGLRVTMQKLDPYLNVDPGTMNPFQHGEVFVTDDGAETDLDIGHYERFLDTDLHGIGQRHHRPGLLDGDRQGAPRRVPRRHGAGHPAHHQRDQGPDPRAWPTDDRDVGRGHHRDRRHRRRHRVAAVPRGGPPGPPRRRPRQLLLPARLAGALHRRRPAS